MSKAFLKLILFLGHIIVSFSLQSQVNLQSGLVAYYPFNANANDLSGNNHNGNIINTVTFLPDRFGVPYSAAKFDGNLNYISVPDNGDFSTPYISLSIWFKTNSDDLQNLIGKRKFENDGTLTGGAQYQFFINYDPYPGIGSNLVGNNSSCSNIASSSYLNTFESICKDRWYHAVVTYDGSYHKVYINGVLKRNELTSFDGFLMCSSELRFGVWWSGETIQFKGLMDDVRWYNRALNQAEVLALYDNYEIQSGLDFSYLQNSCSPKTLDFSAANTAGSTYLWDFGDATAASSFDFTKTYGTFGIYPVKLTITSARGCVDSVTKQIPVLVQQDNALIANSDTSVCSGNPVQLKASKGGLSYCWFPSAGLSSPNTLQPVASPTASTTYYFTSQVESNNLVQNGDFSLGNTGFSSDYTSSSPNTAEAQYFIANDSYAWNVNFNSCVEHTSGAGKMMMVNGSSVSGSTVWYETISVAPNTNYAFSVWIQSLAALNPASLKFSINGLTLGDNINAGTVACEWRQFYTTWNSGNSTNAIISIVNNNTILDGNDFAIDDVSFSRVSLKQDSVVISISPPPTIRTILDTVICKGNSVILNTSGGTVYRWDPVPGISNTGIESPVATPDVSSSYIVSAYNTPGCSGKDTVNITVLPGPSITLTADTAICAGNSLQLSASGGSAYKWSPSAGLSNENIANPVASTDTSILYHINVTGSNGCSSMDSVQISIAQKPVVSTLGDTSLCNGETLRLIVSSSPGTQYSWTPGVGLNDSTIANPAATPSFTTDYIVTARSAADCETKDTVRLTVLSLPVITTIRDTTVCNGQQVQLMAGGGIDYLWSPATGLSDPGLANPVASPDTTTVYKVLVAGSNGCSATDSVSILVRSAGSFSIDPANARVCPGDTLLLTASGGDVYKWLLPSSVFSPDSAATLVSPSLATVYAVSIQDLVCQVTDTLLASVAALPVPNVSIKKSNDIDCFSAGAQLTASGANTYIWSPSAGLSNPVIANPIASPLTTGFYTVKATNAQGCSDYDSVKVEVNFSGNINGYEMPNAFTPNNDGRNDCFGIKKWGSVSRFEFMIYNRWGERVFYTTNASDCWDGTYKSARQDMGSFVYYVKALTTCGGRNKPEGKLLF